MRMASVSFGIIASLAAVAVFACSGCGRKDDAPPPVAEKKADPLPALDPPTASSNPAAGLGTATPTQPVPPELAPVQQGIQAFQAQHNRTPNSVFELLEKKYLKEMPKVPPGKTLYIDPTTGRAQLTDGP